MDLISLSPRSGFAPVLWSSCLATLAVGANSTAIMAALPSMQMELSLSSAGVQWAVNAYLVASAACIVLGGRAADQVGARFASMVGLALFAVASCIIALAGIQATLLAGRALQGFAAAFAVPCTLAAVNASVAPPRRAAAIAAWTGFLMLGFSIGPLVGGALTLVAGWRAIFWLNALLMLAAIAGLAPASLAVTHPDGKRGQAVDWIGFILLATFMVALVFGLHALPEARAAPLPVFGPLALAAVAFVLLLSVEARVEEPLVDLNFFSRREFVMGLTMGSLSMFSIMSLLLYFNLYAQSPGGLGLTALEAGASLLPLSAALLTLALLASAVVARVGLRNAATGGMALMAIACAIVGRGRFRRRADPAGDWVLSDGRGSCPALCLGAATGALGAFLDANGTGVGHYQRLHLSWRQLRRGRRRHGLRARWFCRGPGDDCARRHDRRRAWALNSKDRIAPDTSRASRANMGGPVRAALDQPGDLSCRTCRGARRAASPPWPLAGE